MERWLYLFLVTITVEIAFFIYFWKNQRRELTPKEMKIDDIAGDTEAEFTWSASDYNPIIIVPLVGVYVFYIVLSLFSADEPTRIRNLILKMIVGCLAFVCGALTKSHYRLTQFGLTRIHLFTRRRKNKLLFRWDELESVKPTGYGFKYRLKKRTAEEKPPFWKMGWMKRKGFIPVGKQIKIVVEKLESRGISIRS